jgi:Pentapeptide repeats (8 copies)
MLSKAKLIGARLRAATLDGANLAGADSQQADLFRASLIGSNLSGANLEDADPDNADLTGVDLSRARLVGANLRSADLDETKLIGANLSEVNLRYATLRGADLSGASLRGALLVETDLENAVLTGCFVYGIAAWNIRLSGGTKQQGLVITGLFQPEITVDNIEVAQFVYLLLHNEKIRDVIDTITSKVVLILGRFSIPERKQVLDALRDELRKPERGYVPVVFDFEKSTNRTTDETITLLARMARFVIADISDARSVLQELRAIVPDNPSVPVQSIIDAAQDEPGMFDFFKKYPWFLKVHSYRNPGQLLADLDKRVIAPPEAKAAKREVNAKLASTRLPPSGRSPRARG